MHDDWIVRLANRSEYVHTLNYSIRSIHRRGPHGGKLFARLNFAPEEGFLLGPIKIQADTVCTIARIIIIKPPGCVCTRG